MKIVEYQGVNRIDQSIEDVRAIRSPVMLFLGGLLHIQDIDTQGGFSRYLNQLRGQSGARILFPLDETCNDTQALDDYMVAYGKGNAAPSQFAQDIYRALYAPVLNMVDVNQQRNHSFVKKNWSQISMVGYSYGTSLVQQVAECMALDLSNRMANTPNKGAMIYDMCRSVKAVNIGPVARYNSIESDGTLSKLVYTDEYFADAKTLLSQISFLMRDDKIVQKSFGNELVEGLAHCASGIRLRETESTSLLIDDVGKAQHKVIGYQQVPSGIYFPKIITSYDFILHDLRTYMNRKEAQGNMAVFPSLAIAPVLRQASESMFQPHLDGRDWLRNQREIFNMVENRKELVENYYRNCYEFDKVIEKFESSQYWDGMEYLKSYVQEQKDKNCLTIISVQKDLDIAGQ